MALSSSTLHLVFNLSQHTFCLFILAPFAAVICSCCSSGNFGCYAESFCESAGGWNSF